MILTGEGRRLIHLLDENYEPSGLESATQVRIRDADGSVSTVDVSGMPRTGLRDLLLGMGAIVP